MRKIIPTLDRVLIKEVPATNGGRIAIADAGQKKQQLHGEVIAVGTGRIMQDGTVMPITSVKVGDLVVYGNLMSNVTEYVGCETFTLVQEIGIVAVLEDA